MANEYVIHHIRWIMPFIHRCGQLWWYSSKLNVTILSTRVCCTDCCNIDYPFQDQILRNIIFPLCSCHLPNRFGILNRPLWRKYRTCSLNSSKRLGKWDEHSRRRDFARLSKNGGTININPVFNRRQPQCFAKYISYIPIDVNYH